MTVMADGSAIEVATVGHEGMIGLAAHLGAGTSPYEVMVQVPGQALRLDAAVLRAEAEAAGPLREVLGRYHTAFPSKCRTRWRATACTGSSRGAAAGC